MLRLVVTLAVLGVGLGLPANSNQKLSVSNKKVPLLDGRIVGGDETDIAHHPWQLALLYYLQHYCGATLFHFQWGLTTAHCLEGAIVTNLAVRAGSTLKSSGGQVVNVIHTYTHPNYDPFVIDYDFALLELAHDVSIQTAAPVALPDPNYPVREGDVATITGWGTLSSAGITPEILHEVEVPVISLETCQSVYGSLYVTPRMFCTGHLGTGGKDACQGDGGGPVSVGGHLAGLVSWGSGCADPYYPGVQASVSTVVGWIHDTSGI